MTWAWIIRLAVWFAFLVLMGYLYQRETKWITRFSIFTVLMVTMLVRYGIAVPFSDTINPISTHLSITQTQLNNYYAGVVLMYLGMLAGIVLVRRLSNRLPSVDTNGPATVDVNALTIVAAVLIALVALVWIVLPWDSFKGGVAAILAHHSAVDYRTHRVQYGGLTQYSVSALNYFGSFARFALFPALLWILWFHRRLSRRIAALFWLTLGLTVVIGVFSGQKLPALLVLLGFWFAYLLVRNRPNIFNWKLGLASVGFVTIVAPALYHLEFPSWPYGELFRATLARLSSEYSRVGQLRFMFYPDRHPYLHGFSSFVLRGAAHLVGIKTGDAESPESYIPAHSPGVGAAYGGTWNAGFFADAWADFGFIGIIVASIAAGVIVMLIHRWYVSSPQGPLQMGMYTALCMSVMSLSEVALPTSLWTYGLLSGFLVYLVLRPFPMHVKEEQFRLRRTMAAADHGT
jgi:hypothetical protein